MMAINNGGPAFPITEVYSEGQGMRQGFDGMTLRDYFAAKALQGLTANRRDIFDGGREDICRFAYLYADQMIKERNKG